MAKASQFQNIHVLLLLKITITFILYTHYNNVSEFFVEETHDTIKLAALYHVLISYKLKTTTVY